MDSVISTHKSVMPYMGVTYDQIVDFAGNGKFRVLVYGAYNAGGLIGSEMNGIAILREDPPSVVCDGICKQDSGYFGPNQAQVEMFNRIVGMKWKEFQETANSSDRLRAEI